MGKRKYESEQKLVIDTFQKSFSSQNNKKIVLYGIGKNTEAVLYGTEGFSFAGLMDQSSVGQTIYGQKVLSDEEVIELCPVIVIIARQSVVNIIFKRIQYLNTEHGIPIYDFQGNLLGSESLVYKNSDLLYWNASEQELIEKIRENDIISFDIFDTLLMRRVLQPTDVFELVEIQLREQGYIYPFADMRLKAEQVLKMPDIDEIYKKMQEIYDVDDFVLQHMKKLECEIDACMLLRREKMCQIYQIALKEGKEVYLLSDMYYPKLYLEGLLKDKGIVGYRDLFVSCDIKKEKSDGSLYQWYVSKLGSGRMLHIGDNRRVDIVKAIEHGINAYHIYSAYELLMASSMQSLLSDVGTLQRRCILGLIISRVYNNPFRFYLSRGYLQVNDIRELGYFFIAPMLAEFVRWFIFQAKERKVQQILFPSRDGYLIKRIYELMADNDIETVYFRTSRRAATVAGIYDLDDIKRIASRKYKGTYSEFLKSRFGINMKDTDIYREAFIKDQNDELTQKILRDYEISILQNAKVERKQYLGYLDNMGILTDKIQVLFDFVAGGTVQYNLCRLLQKNIKGLYFATMNLPNDMYAEDIEDIAAAYGNITSYGSQNQLSKYYLFVETILIDDKESFSHIDSMGKEVFEQGSAKSNFSEIEQLHKGVFDYVTEYQQYFSVLKNIQPELEFTDMLFGMLFSEQSIVSEKIKNVFQNDDIYDGIEAYSLWNG